VFEFRCNLYAKEGQLGRMDARRDTAVMPWDDSFTVRFSAILDRAGYGRTFADVLAIYYVFAH